MQKKELLARYILFTIALFISALGVSLITRATLGTSPISSIPFVLSQHTPLSMGSFTFLFNVVLMGIQFALLGRNCTKKQATEILLQLPVSVLFGIFIDLTMTMLAVYTPTHYALCLAELLLGCVVLALGVVGEVIANVVMLSGELTVQIASKKFKKEFGMVKMAFDCTLVILACLTSLLLCHHEGLGFVIDGVREGTIIGALIIGPIVRWLRPHFGWLERRLAFFTSSVSDTYTSTSAQEQPLVITIAREFGSGGHQLAQRLAKELGLAYFDKQLIELAAKESGFTEQYVQENEQNMPSSLLYQLIMQDYEVPMEKSLSSADTLFVAQSKVIRRIAASQPCIIVGRLANYILKDYPNSLHLFIHANTESEVARAISDYGLAPSRAAAEVERINQARSQHYLHYTSWHWHDSRHYDLTLNLSHIGMDEACRIVTEQVKQHLHS